MDQKTVKKRVVGVDVSLDATAYAIVDVRGNIIVKDSFPTEDYPEIGAFVAKLSDGIIQMIEANGGYESIRSVGISAPSANYKLGSIVNSPNFPWKGVIPLSALLRDRLGLAVAVANNSHVVALGEHAFGCARGIRDFIVITLGTGVGSGIVVNGQLLYGHDGFAGELGHVTMVRGEEGRSCGCGRTGCLEAYCSATGVARTARELLAKTDRPSLLREMDPEKITSLDVSIAAGKGDELAKDIYEFTGKMLGEACADFAAFSSPEAFIFFGGMVKAGELIMKPIREAYNAHVLKIFKDKAQFLVSGLDGASAAVLGASAIGWEIQ